MRKLPEGVAEYASDVPDGVALFAIVLEVICVPVYRKGFGHTDLVELGIPEGGKDPG